MSCKCCLALPRGAMGLPAVCDCGNSRSYSLTIRMFSLVKKENMKCIIFAKGTNQVAFRRFLTAGDWDCVAAVELSLPFTIV